MFAQKLDNIFVYGKNGKNFLIIIYHWIYHISYIHIFLQNFIFI